MRIFEVRSKTVEVLKAISSNRSLVCELGPQRIVIGIFRNSKSQILREKPLTGSEV
jgi:hypothetical protein